MRSDNVKSLLYEQTVDVEYEYEFREIHESAMKIILRVLPASVANVSKCYTPECVLATATAAGFGFLKYIYIKLHARDRLSTSLIRVCK